MSNGNQDGPQKDSTAGQRAELDHIEDAGNDLSLSKLFRFGAANVPQPSFPDIQILPLSPVPLCRKEADRLSAAEQLPESRELQEYYSKIWRKFSAGLRDRPLALVRCKKNKETIFLPSPRGMHDDLSQITASPQTGGYRTVGCLNDLLTLLRSGVVELHPWNATQKNSLRPDRITFSLDAGAQVDGSALIHSALLLRLMLDEMKLSSFVRVSGGRGLHVVVPLKPLRDDETVKNFAATIARTFELEAPAKYTARPHKTIPKRKILIGSFHQNPGSPAIADYSVRYRPGSPVALPLSWTELENSRELPRFSSTDALPRIKKQRLDPWSDFHSRAGIIPDTIPLFHSHKSFRLEK
jgi:bifunctional non-homologous end joining protein LigD